MFRLESYEIAKVRQNEMLRDAERARLAARINHRSARQATEGSICASRRFVP